MSDLVRLGLTTLLTTAAGAFAGAWGMQRVEEERQRRKLRAQTIRATRRAATACDELLVEISETHKKGRADESQSPARRLRRTLTEDHRLLGIDGIIEVCPSVKHQKNLMDALSDTREGFEAWCRDVEAGIDSNAGHSSTSQGLQDMGQYLRAYAAWVDWGWGYAKPPTPSDLAEHEARMRPAWKKMAEALGQKLIGLGKVPTKQPTKTWTQHPDDEPPPF